MQPECTEMILDENGVIVGLDCILHRGLYTYEEIAGKSFIDVFIKDENKQEVQHCIDNSIDFKVYINYKRETTKLVCFEVKHHSKQGKPKSKVSLFGTESNPILEKKIFHLID